MIKLRLRTLILLQFLALVGSEYVYGEPEYKCPKKPKVLYPCVCLKGSDNGLYVRCENTNLATLSVALQNLASLEVPVEELTIYKGHFVRLFGPLFAKLKVRLLKIEETPLATIEDYVFYGTNNTLEQLHLLHTNLSQVGKLAFGILGHASQLVIDGHAFEKLPKDLFVGQDIANKLEVIRIINGRLSDLPVETFQPLRKLKTLDLHGNKLENLKRSQFKNLRELEVLDISHNKIIKLEAQHIADLTKLGWFNASHNALKELSRGTFARNSVLKLLNLSHNNITRLDGNSFRGMRFLRRLFLSDNGISDVGRGTFGSVARIGTIDLARNKLKKVEYQMFTQMNYVELIDLAENNISKIEKNSFKDIYQAVINVSHNALELIESAAFENCVNITVLDLSHNRLANFSRRSFDETTFASEFQLSYNELTNLAHIPIQNMTGLRVLNASHNQIAEIPKNSFPKLYELHTIDVSHNNISFIFNGVFQTLFSLRSVDLSHNSMQEIKSSTFGTLPTLLEMNLSHNLLTNIVRGSLAKLTSLRQLYLNNNQLQSLFQLPISLNELYLGNNNISSIPPNTWPVMNSLIYLDLSNNQLADSLDGNSFTGLLVVQRLMLQNNGITKPPLAALAVMSTLQYLHLEYNNITTLERSAFGKLPVLFEINLHGNQVSDISKRAFEGLLQLLTLNMSSNDLQQLSNDIFIGLPSLRILDLSHNAISKLDNKTHGVLDDLLSLERLDLSQNRISFVTKKTFPSHQYVPYNLKYLDLSYNQMPVLTYDITFGTKKLLHLNLSHNLINELRRGVLANFTSLQLLDLSHNELSNLQSEEHIFDLPSNLMSIDLSYNKIYHLPFANLVKSVPLAFIDLRQNELEHFPPSLVESLRNGSEVFLAGNPLHCSCNARPLKHYMLEQTEVSDDLKSLRCRSPSPVYDQRLLELSDEYLSCMEDEKQLYNGIDYDQLTEVRFRDVQTNKAENLTLRWYVSAASDVADFHVYIRSSSNEVLYQVDYAYNERIAQIPIAELKAHGTEKLRNAEICIVSRNSLEKLNKWFEGQCQKLPELKVQKTFFFGNFRSRSAAPQSPFARLYIYVMFFVIVIKYSLF
ncbi:insulin-like growth factor-binding protein complex acid labile subunit [Scaptodrosophila lebanonensis]|uniref:Insulin-like growth factor-binding protein complex acid labile subunit n=1 Tax=Drosophila lebanonensis TaxID=7225 RepID=A0A6J2U7F9_DROLE|nr:insulin-like growth factor-binding protein complex acid labile subunit [Scaptodrosophila lebanonensis]